MIETKKSLLPEEQQQAEVIIAPKAEKIDGYNPRKGFTALLVSTILISTSRLGCKYLYNEHPHLSSIEFVFYRALLGFAFNILWLNRNLKKEMYTSVKRELVP